MILAGCGEDPRGIVEAMGRAYRTAPTYSDDGRVTVRATRGDVAEDMAYPFRVAFSRPDRLRIEAYDARIVADGTTLFAAVGSVPGQVLQEPVTSPLAMDQIFADDELRATLAEGEAGCPTQLPLLLADDTIDLILADMKTPPRLMGTEDIEGHSCHRIAIEKPDGVLELWIDRASHLLRRMKVPTDAYADELTRQTGAPLGVSVVVEFAKASFDASIPAEAFAFEVPADAAQVSRLEPLQAPQPVHPLVGKPAELPPLVTPDGATISRESLLGTAAVLEFFFEGCGPSSDTMPQVATGIADHVSAYARSHEGERPPVRHFAVSLDPDEVAVAAIRKTLAEFGGVGTLVRDPQGVTVQALSIETFPATVVVAADGTVTDVITGRPGTIAADVADSLAGAAAGLPAEKRLRDRYERRLGDYRRELARAAGAGGVERPPEQVIAPRRQPVRFKLERAWRAAGVTLPGNVVCLDASRGAADAVRIVCLDGWRTVVELDAAGAEVGRYELDLPPDTGVGGLRTAVDSSGRRWWLGLRRGGQQVSVFTDDWKHHATYPESGGTNHDGISAAELADLDGDGMPEIVVGHSGPAGVEVATLAGTRLWQDRSVGSVIECAIGPPVEAGGARMIACVDAEGRLVKAVHHRDRTQGIAEPDPSDAVRFTSLASGPAAMDHDWALLGIARPSAHNKAAVGIDPVSLEPTWQFPLAEGNHRDGPIEPVTWADLLGTRRRQWLIAAPDGSVTVAWADGGVVDRYQHGRPLVGIGGYRDGGAGHIVLATRDALEAYAVVDVALD
jgi:outer membrane lipoprotein-sorting protein